MGVLVEVDDSSQLFVGLVVGSGDGDGLISRGTLHKFAAREPEAEGTAGDLT